MKQSSIRLHRTIAVVATFAIVAWGIAGHLDRQGKGRFDPLFEPDYTVFYAPEAGTLALAGFQSGDSIVSVEGIPVVELGMYSRWPRSLSGSPGDSLTLVAERDGRLISGEIVLREPSAGSSNLIIGGVVIVLAFVISGLFALFTTESIHAVRLVYIGLALGAAIPGPYLGSWDGFAMHFQVAVLVLWTLLLLRFFLHYPTSKRIAKNRLFTAITFGAWLLLLGTLVLELIFHPRLYHSFGPLYGLLMFIYATLAVVALLHTLFKTPTDDQRASGVGIVLVGVLAGLVPTLVALIDQMFLWNLDIPGSGWFVLAIVAIPFSLAFAVRRQARSGLSPR
jgi:hypothetical protein